MKVTGMPYSSYWGHADIFGVILRLGMDKCTSQALLRPYPNHHCNSNANPSHNANYP